MQEMKRLISYMICALVLTSASSCDFRALSYGYYPLCNLNLKVNWQFFGEIPTGMTAVFYPKDKGQEPFVHTTNSVHSTVISLDKGVYDIILFNQSPGEFGTLDFSGLGKFETAEVYLFKAGMTGSSSLQPEPIAVATMKDFTVTDEMVERSMVIHSNKDEGYGGESHIGATIVMTPKSVVTPGKVLLHIKGLKNLSGLKGSISGVAYNFLPAPYASGTKKTSHILSPWKKVEKSDILQCPFDSFGHPLMALNCTESIVMTKDAASDWGDATIDLSMLLVDNKTILDYSFKVADYVRKVEEEDRITLIIEIDGQIDLPDVEPANQGGAGFEVSVDDWGEEEGVKVQM